MSPPAAAPVLDPWYYPFETYLPDRSGFYFRDFFFPHSEAFECARIVIKVPSKGKLKRCCVRLEVEGGVSRDFVVWPGRFVLSVDLRLRPAGTQFSIRCVEGTQFGADQPDRPFRFKSVRFCRSHSGEPLSMRRWTPLDRKPRADEQPASPFLAAVEQFTARWISVDDTNNATQGSTINTNPDENGVNRIGGPFRTNALRPVRGEASGDCYLVASGPSVGEVDFNVLKDRTLFGVNGSSALLSKYPIRFSHYLVVDSYFACIHFPMVREAIRSGARCFFTINVLAIICATEPELLKSGNIHLVDTAFDEQSDPDKDIDFVFGRYGVRFSKNAEKCIDPRGTVAYAAMQLCRYLGFQRVFTLGVDLSNMPDKYRFYDGEDEADVVKIFSQRLDDTLQYDILPAFETLGRLLKDPDETFQVFNLSAQSRLPSEFVPKMTLEESLKLSSA